MKFAGRQNIPLLILRLVAAAIMISHGMVRIYLGTVEELGSFLTQNAFPLGFYLAWAVTVFEIGGGLVLIAGRFIALISLVFAVHLFAGILLVHLREGWFVVGAGRNGVEYSVLLISVFIALAVSSFEKRG